MQLFRGLDMVLFVFTCTIILDSLYTVTTALQAALELAEQISSFPQQCLRADRSSAIYSCYDAPSFTQVHLMQLYILILRNTLTGEGRAKKSYLYE